MRRYVAVLVAAVLFLTAPAAAIDINDTDSLDYYSDSTLDFRVNPDGTIDAQGDIDLNGNRLGDSTGATTLDGNVSVPNGNLDVSGSLSAGDSYLQQDKIQFGNFQYFSGLYSYTDSVWGYNARSASGDPATLKTPYTASSAISPQAIVMGQNNGIHLVTTHIDPTTTDSFTWNDYTGLSVDKSQNVNIPNGNLDMGNNDIIDTNSFYLDSNSVTTFWDGTPSSPSGRLLKIYDSGNVEIPNGDLVMGDTAVRNANYFSGRANARQRVNMKTNGDIALQTDNGGSASTGLRVKDGNQNVEVPNGNLDISSGRIKIANDNWFMSETSGGTNAGLLKTTTGDHTLLHSNAGQNVQIEEGNDRMMTLYGSTNNVEIPNGNLYVSGSGRFNSLVGDSSGSQCGSNEFVNGNGNCETDTNTDTDNQNLQDVLAQGNEAGGFNINMTGGNITSDTEICAGNQCPA